MFRIHTLIKESEEMIRAQANFAYLGFERWKMLVGEYRKWKCILEF